MTTGLQCSCFCRQADLEQNSLIYTTRPDGENDFGIPADLYHRAYDRCNNCGHYSGRHDLDLSGLYSGDYVDALYGDATGLARTFDRIMALPADSSDNRARVVRIDSWLRQSGLEPNQARLLDIGSGLAVFPAGMQRAGWHITALDPDERACHHARDHAGVPTICADITDLQEKEPGQFDLLSMNKVLEHIVDPLAVLKACHQWLSDHGQIYIELPDADMALQDSPLREEFFIEHHHVFSLTSMIAMTEKAGFTVFRSERLREPSGKYTLFLFAGRTSS